MSDERKKDLPFVKVENVSKKIKKNSQAAALAAAAKVMALKDPLQGLIYQATQGTGEAAEKAKAQLEEIAAQAQLYGLQAYQYGLDLGQGAYDYMQSSGNAAMDWMALNPMASTAIMMAAPALIGSVVKGPRAVGRAALTAGRTMIRPRNLLRFGLPAALLAGGIYAYNNNDKFHDFASPYVGKAAEYGKVALDKGKEYGQKAIEGGKDLWNRFVNKKDDKVSKKQRGGVLYRYKNGGKLNG